MFSSGLRPKKWYPSDATSMAAAPAPSFTMHKAWVAPEGANVSILLRVKLRSADRHLTYFLTQIYYVESFIHVRHQAPISECSDGRSNYLN